MWIARNRAANVKSLGIIELDCFLCHSSNNSLYRSIWNGTTVCISASEAQLLFASSVMSKSAVQCDLIWFSFDLFYVHFSYRKFCSTGAAGELNFRIFENQEDRKLRYQSAKIGPFVTYLLDDRENLSFSPPVEKNNNTSSRTGLCHI